MTSTNSGRQSTAIVGTANFLADERGPGFVVRFPTIRF